MVEKQIAEAQQSLETAQAQLKEISDSELSNKGKGIDDKGNVLWFDIVVGVLDCSNKKLVSLEVPQGVTHLYCSYNNLTSLEVPQGVTHLYCHNNNLTSLEVPQGVKYLSCDNNNLTSLEVPQGVEYLYCSNNPLISLSVPQGFDIKELLNKD